MHQNVDQFFRIETGADQIPCNERQEQRCELEVRWWFQEAGTSNEAALENGGNPYWGGANTRKPVQGDLLIGHESVCSLHGWHQRSRV